MPFTDYFVGRFPGSLHLPLKLGISIALVFIMAAMFLLGCVGRSLFEQPDSDQFLAIFFQEPFVILITLVVVWYTVSFKSTPARLDEYKFLSSLPISAGSICDRFIGQDLLRYSWVPGLGIVIYFGLLPVSPISHLFRLSILTVFGFILFVVANTVLHLLSSLKGRNPGSYAYPGRTNPIIIAVIILGYAVSQMSFIITPALASGYQFWIVFILLLLGNSASLVLARFLFSKWQTKNSAFQMWADQTITVRSSWLRASNQFRLFAKTDPFLLKNLLKIRRENTGFSMILTAMFIMLAYLISMNNENINDSISVLFAISCIYSFLIAFRTINQFSPDEESPDLVYSLPLRTWNLYFSVFIPAMGWLAVVLASLTILISGGAGSLAGSFLLQSLFAAAAFLLVASNYALGSYPDIKEAQKRFLYWTTALMVLTAVLYKYRIITVSLLIILPFLQLRKVRFYRVG